MIIYCIQYCMLSVPSKLSLEIAFDLNFRATCSMICQSSMQNGFGVYQFKHLVQIIDIPTVFINAKDHSLMVHGSCLL